MSCLPSLPFHVAPAQINLASTLSPLPRSWYGDLPHATWRHSREHDRQKHRTASNALTWIEIMKKSRKSLVSLSTRRDERYERIWPLVLPLGCRMRTSCFYTYTVVHARQPVLFSKRHTGAGPAVYRLPNCTYTLAMTGSES